MTEVAFHFNAPDKLAYACRFARKALRNDARLVITASDSELDTLDHMLWNMAAHDFVAHCRAGADADILHASPIVLTADATSTYHQDVLLNLGSTVPSGFERFARLVEVVSSDDEADRAGARGRWRHYTAQGYQIHRHDLVLKAD